MRSYRVIPSALFSVTLLHLVSVTTAIKCFTCNEEKNITCPGWDRSEQIWHLDCQPKSIVFYLYFYMAPGSGEKHKINMLIIQILTS